MFTGIVETTTEIVERRQKDDLLILKLSRPADWPLRAGQSIAVNGACLTVVRFDDQSFEVELMPETVAHSNLGDTSHTQVNIERAMSAQGLFEGHIVQGHVDTVATVSERTAGTDTTMLRVTYDSSFDELVVVKGSIAINGVSLTVVDPQPGSLGVGLIPQTLKVTNLSELQVNDQVNLEFDIIGKYITKQARTSK